MGSMKVLCIILLYCVLGILPARAETAFFETLPDVPVAKGLQLLPDQDLVFDKPEARIVETVSLVGDASQAHEIEEYYRKTLPAFGWTLLSDGVYRRGVEDLRFWFDSNEGRQFFYLRIEPANQ